MDIQLTASHWIYAVVTIIVILTMLLKKGVVVPTLIGTFVIGWVFHGSLVKGFQAIFNANLVAAKELFSIFLIITFMVALLESLKDLGSDRKMVQPIEKVMKNGHWAFFALFIVTYVISLFFWPTPAVPLIGALLIPAAIRAGLPAMGAGIAIAIAGQGMALSSDYVMQVAPGLSAKSAGIDVAGVADKAMVLSLITGIVAIGIAYFSIRKLMRSKDSKEIEKELAVLNLADAESEVAVSSDVKPKTPMTKLFATLVPLSMLLVMVYMVYTKFSPSAGGVEGGDGAALIGGVAILLLILASFAYKKDTALDHIADHIVAGFVFAFKAMGPVIPIAGFFFMGAPDFVAPILGIAADAPHPGFLFDLVQAINLPENGFIAAFGILIIGMITGLDGSGFSGLPLTGGLSGAIADSVGVTPDTLAAIGQMGAIWTGGGTIIAWSSLVAVAAFAGVPVLELARKNMIPVLIGLAASTLFGLIFWG